MFTANLSSNIIIGIIICLLVVMIACIASICVKHKKAEKNKELCMKRVEKIKAK